MVRRIEDQVSENEVLSLGDTVVSAEQISNRISLDRAILDLDTADDGQVGQNGALPGDNMLTHASGSPLIDVIARDSSKICSRDEFSFTAVSVAHHVIGSSIPVTNRHPAWGLGTTEHHTAERVENAEGTEDVSMQDADSEVQESLSIPVSDRGVDDGEEDAALLDLLESKLIGAAPDSSKRCCAVSAEEEVEEISLEELEMLEASIAAGLC
jgi:hypothetical protein